MSKKLILAEGVYEPRKGATSSFGRIVAPAGHEMIFEAPGLELDRRHPVRKLEITATAVDMFTIARGAPQKGDKLQAFVEVDTSEQHPTAKVTMLMPAPGGARATAA